MRIYSIFHIKEKYRPFVFGRERMLLEMILEEHGIESSAKRQLTYLCESFEDRRVQGIIYEHLQKSFPNMKWVGDYLGFEHQLKGCLKIKVNTHHIEAICEGSRMLDLDLFHCLSHINDSFIAFNKRDSECGWLKPVKYVTN